MDENYQNKIKQKLTNIQKMLDEIQTEYEKTTELKLCPFCGETDIFYSEKSCAYMCSKCGARGGVSIFAGSDKSDWNERAEE